MSQEPDESAKKDLAKSTLHGPQGDDKAPGEDPALDLVDLQWESQKGKTNDGDPTDPKDQPVPEEGV